MNKITFLNGISSKMISTFFKKTGNFFLKIADKISRQHIPVEPLSLQGLRVIPWFKDRGDHSHRLNYDLNKDSIVFDLGGYEGEWAGQIYCLYGSFIYIFEPYEKYFENIKNKFRYNKKIKIFKFGLSGISQTSKLGIAENCSSVFLTAEHSVDIELVCANDFFIEQGIDKIDLMKINIEGGEFDLLDHLIEAGIVNKIVNIQVQFHDFVPEAEIRMKIIQQQLRRTHELTYQYEFVWENWKLK